MNTYAINLVVDNINRDMYDKVALNDLPIIIKCKSDEELKKILSKDISNKYLQKYIKTHKSFDTAEWHIRCIYDNDVKDIIWKVSDLNKYS